MSDTDIEEALLDLAPLADMIERLAIYSGRLDPEEIDKTVPEITDDLRQRVQQ